MVVREQYSCRTVARYGSYTRYLDKMVAGVANTLKWMVVRWLLGSSIALWLARGPAWGPHHSGAPAQRDPYLNYRITCGKRERRRQVEREAAGQKGTGTEIEILPIQWKIEAVNEIEMLSTVEPSEDWESEHCHLSRDWDIEVFRTN